jgi:RNA polymerase sigma-70 factor (ECF subfamily)
MAASTATGALREGEFSAAPASDDIRQRFDNEAMPHHRDLARTAGRLIGDRVRAEDVVQEVFLEAWRSFGRYEPGTNCRAWLFKILMFKVQHHRRSWFRLRLFSPDEDPIGKDLAYSPPIPEHVTDEEVLAALDRVPRDFRAVILLVDVEEFSYKEAADILAIPIGTVMSRLSRGRRLLREYLAGVALSYGFGGANQKGQKS